MRVAPMPRSPRPAPSAGAIPRRVMVLPARNEVGRLDPWNPVGPLVAKFRVPPLVRVFGAAAARFRDFGENPAESDAPSIAS